MKIPLRLCLFSVLLLISCGGNRKADAETKMASDPAEETDFFVFDLGAGIDSSPRDTTINNLIESVSYIPLETGKGFMLPNSYYHLAKMNGYFFIDAGFGNNNKVPILQFDSLGRYVKTLIHLGRGPNEVPFIREWHANANLDQINVMGSGGRMVIVSLNSGEKSSVWLRESSGYGRIPLNDSTFVSHQFLSSILPIDTDTYLYFTDRNDSIIHSAKRNDELSNYRLKSQSEGELIPTAGSFEDYGLYPDYRGDAIFRDIFNDTLYRVKSRTEITPHLVFKRGVFSPDPKNSHKSLTASRQISFSHLKESGNYVFLRYRYGWDSYYTVWSKQDGALIIHYKWDIRYDFIAPFALPDGGVIELPIVYAEKDRIYGILNATLACKFLPDVKEDDNPVIVVAKLRK